MLTPPGGLANYFTENLGSIHDDDAILHLKKENKCFLMKVQLHVDVTINILPTWALVFRVK